MTTQDNSIQDIKINVDEKIHAPTTPIVDTISNTNWNLGEGRTVSKDFIQYIFQMVLLATCIITSIVNLSIPNQTNHDVWVTMLSTCVGVLVPSPSISHSPFQSKTKLSDVKK